MLHPAFINLNYFFYATGNTPAICLTQDLPPEKSANLLLLGCGDPRNVLFSLYNSDPDGKRNTFLGVPILFDLANSSSRTKGSRILDFTCCDLEPALLARNVLLFTLLLDDLNTNEDNCGLHWNIFYHFLLDNDSLQLLLRQSNKLVELSVDEATWRKSEYGEILRMISSDTLMRMRWFWQKYAEIGDYTEEQIAAYEHAFREGWDRIYRNYVGAGRVVSGCLSAGPLWMESTRASDLSFRKFWKTGVVGGNAVDLAAAKHVNPSFAFSSAPTGAFSVHYGTDPLLGFHSVTAYTVLHSRSAFYQSPSLIQEGPEEQVNRAVFAAKAQFNAWCNSFKHHSAKNSVTLRFFVGEALAFCQALRLKTSAIGPEDCTFGFLQPWKPNILEIDGGDYRGTDCKAPLCFDVIETSDLADHVGLLNLLICAGPLLVRESTSTLYTETLLPPSEEAISVLPSLVLGDLPTISVLLGLAPLGYLTSIVSQATFHEAGLVLGTTSINNQLHNRIPWKIPILGDGIATKLLMYPKCRYDEAELANLLFDVYIKMFGHESITNLRQKVSRGPAWTMSYNHYTRAAYVALINHIRTTVAVNWSKFMDILLTKIELDRSLLLGSNAIQELFLHCYLQGVYSADVLERKEEKQPLKPELPDMSCIALTVPRRSLTIFTRMNRRELGTPQFVGSVKSSDFHDIFSSVHAVFGKLILSSDRKSFSVMEDTRGWLGASDMIVSFWVPTYILHREPESSIKVGLQLAATIQMAPIFITSLGPELIIYETKLSNSSHIVICEEMAGIKPKFLTAKYIPEVGPLVSNPYIGVRVSPISVALTADNRLDKFKVRLDYNNCGKEHNALKAGASVDVKQDSPCTILLAVTGCKKNRLAFPFPVNALQQTVRVARRSGWIELLIEASHPTDIAGFSLNILPVLFDEYPMVWCVPYLTLDKLPILDTASPNNTDRWLNSHVSSMWSDREKRIRNDGEQMDLRMEMKETIHTIFLRSSGLAGSAQQRVFSFCVPENGGNHMLIFVADLRLDLSSQSVVVDAYVLPLMEDMILQYPRLISRLHREGIVNIRMGEGELKGWKDMMPAFAERCRTWKHTKHCEYRKYGIPVSTEMGLSPFCSCGLGKVKEHFTEHKEWEPFKNYVTRIALTPLFAVNYIESTVGNTKEMFLNTKELTTRESYGNLPGDACKTCGTKQSEMVSLMSCSRCKRAMYCSQVCQKQDWANHKLDCRQQSYLHRRTTISADVGLGA